MRCVGGMEGAERLWWSEGRWVEWEVEGDEFVDSAPWRRFRAWTNSSKCIYGGVVVGRKLFRTSVSPSLTSPLCPPHSLSSISLNKPVRLDESEEL